MIALRLSHKDAPVIGITPSIFTTAGWPPAARICALAQAGALGTIVT